MMTDSASLENSSSGGNFTSGNLFPDLDPPQTWRVVATVTFFVTNVLSNAILAVAAWTGLRRSRGATRRLSLVTDFPQSTRRQKELKATACDHILLAVFFVAMCRSCTRAPVQVVQMLTGEPTVGHLSCQLQGFLSCLLEYLHFWYLMMFVMERYMRNSSPYEYTLTFSPLNAYVILPGLFLVIVPQVTGPMYGWGRYDLIPELYVCDLASDSKHSCSYQMFTNFEVLFPVILMSLYSTLSFLLRTPEQPAKTTGESRLLFPRKEKLTVLVICIFCCILVPSSFAGVHTVRACVTSVPPWLLVSMDLACELNLFIPPVLVYVFHGQRIRSLFVEDRQRENIPLVSGPPRKSFIGMTDL
ncbi:adenosine receptor A1 [Galendromus occidentalis]|uniref:Adenosine receptor A1 n=1 Tax=Galendromus occidentalis TaxID=34638 RepID=A0AAJ6QQG7_9ACAR|nr:adenosine receptor A1 [Galendromus occidentalis]